MYDLMFLAKTDTTRVAPIKFHGALKISCDRLHRAIQGGGKETSITSVPGEATLLPQATEGHPRRRETLLDNTSLYGSLQQ